MILFSLLHIFLCIIFSLITTVCGTLNSSGGATRSNIGSRTGAQAPFNTLGTAISLILSNVLVLLGFLNGIFGTFFKALDVFFVEGYGGLDGGLVTETEAGCLWFEVKIYGL